MNRLFGLMLLCGLLSLQPGALAKEQPLKVKLETGINAETARHGDPFEGVLAEPFQAGKTELPAGSRIKGQVHNARKSYPFAMPGYVTLDVQDITLPGGTTYHLGQEAMTTEKIIHPKAKTKKKLLQSALPFTLVSAADSIPLKYAAGLSTWQIVPISLAARMTLGTLLELTPSEKKDHDEKNHPPATRIGHGVLRGTGLTGAYYFIRPSQEPELTPGAIVPIEVDADELSRLMQTSPATASMPAPMESEGQGFGQVYGKIPQNKSGKQP